VFLSATRFIKNIKNMRSGFIQTPILIILAAIGIFIVGNASYRFLDDNKTNKDEEIKVLEEKPDKTKEVDLSNIFGEETEEKISTNSESKIRLYPSSEPEEEPAAEVVSQTAGDADNNAETETNDYVDDLADRVAKEIKQPLYLGELDDDIDDFNRIIKAVQDDRERYISFAEKAARQRLDALNGFIYLATDPGIKNFVQSLADDEKKNSDEARKSYTELFGFLESEITDYITKLENAKEEITEDKFIGSVDDLLSQNTKQKEYFIGLMPQFTKSAQELEERKADNFSDGISYLHNLLAVSETLSSVNQKLSQIEQEARENIVSNDEVNCWATTEYSGGLNGTSKTRVRCE